MANENQTVPIIHKMMAILDYIEGHGEGATLTQICHDLELPKTTVFRILKTLEEHRVLEYGEEHRRYTLGPRLMSMAGGVKAKDILSVSRPVMEAVSAKLAETCKLSVAEETGVVVVSVTQSPTGFGIFTQVGRTFPYHAGAASKVCLAHRSETFVSRIVSEGLSSFTERTITNPVALRNELELIRQQGWAIDDEEYVKGIVAIAAPIFDASKRVVAALSVTFLAARSERERLEIRREVVRGAGEVSLALGAASHSAPSPLELVTP